MKPDISPKDQISPEGLEALGIIKYLHELGAVEVSVDGATIYARFYDGPDLEPEER